jgi:hypothetical protein
MIRLLCMKLCLLVQVCYIVRCWGIKLICNGDFRKCRGRYNCGTQTKVWHRIIFGALVCYFAVVLNLFKPPERDVCMYMIQLAIKDTALYVYYYIYLRVSRSIILVVDGCRVISKWFIKYSAKYIAIPPVYHHWRLVCIK